MVYVRQVAYRAAVVARQAREWADICATIAQATAVGAAPVDSWSSFIGEEQEVVAAVEVCEAVYAAARAAGRAAAAAQRAECGVSPFSDRTLSSLQAARQWARLQAIKRAYAADDRIRRGGR